MRTAAGYVLHCFDDIGQRLPGESIDTEHDVVAIAFVPLHLHKRCELWQGDRLVFSVPEKRA